MSDGHQIERRYLIRRPQALQYYHKGKLMKASEKERVSGRFELFFDLLYVALIANFAEYLSEEPSGTRLVIYILIFTPAWHVWADAKENANNYYNDDLLQRLGVLWIMALLVLYGNNANRVGEDFNSLQLTVGTYMVMRFSQVSYFAYYSIASHYHRVQNRVYVGLTCVGLLIWAPLFVESISERAKVAVTVVALIWEEITYVAAFGPWLADYLDLEFRTAVDVSHVNDRYTGFTIIILGEFTYNLLVGSPAYGGITLGIMRATWTLVIAFCFNSFYTYSDGAINSVHPIRRSTFTSLSWLMIQEPLSAGLLIGGHCSAIAVNPHREFGEGQRWLWGGGLAVGYFCMWVIGWLYLDMDPPGKLVLPKWARIAPRLVSAIILVSLPLTSPEQLNETSLLSIGAGISVFTLIWETVGGLERGAYVFEPWRHTPAEEDADMVEVESKSSSTELGRCAYCAREA